MSMLSATTILAYPDGTHHVHTTDVIEFRGTFWLVPEWLDNRVQKLTKPVRIVSLATLPHSRTGRFFVVNDPIPKSVFDGQIPPQEAGKFVVIENPDISFPIDTLH